METSYFEPDYGFEPALTVTPAPALTLAPEPAPEPAPVQSAESLPSDEWIDKSITLIESLAKEINVPKDVIYKLSMEHDFIGVLDTIVASSHGINFSDSTVTEYMLAFLNNHSDEKFFEDRAGNLYSFKDIVGIIAEEIKAEREQGVTNGNEQENDGRRTRREHERRTA